MCQKKGKSRVSIQVVCLTPIKYCAENAKLCWKVKDIVTQNSTVMHNISSTRKGFSIQQLEYKNKTLCTK